MKKIIFIVFSMLMLNVLTSQAQLKVNSSGYVGVGRTPSYKLDVEGTARFSNWTDVIIDWTGFCCGAPVIYPERNWYLQLGKSDRWINHLWVYDIDYSNLHKTSDFRAKENIDTLNSVLSKLKQINSYKYNFKDDFLKDIPEHVRGKYKKTEYGFIAQELDKVFPELVHKPDSGMLSVDYVSMVPILTEAIKEQQNQISTLQSIVYSQEKELIELKKEVEKLSKKDSKLKSASTSSNDLPEIAQNSNLLMQNSPNPFTVDTEIKYFISDEVSTALLIIHDMQGLEILSYNLNERGNGSKIIQASELKAGMYLYTLIADGNIIDSKRMILTSE